jgi:hypothetical protein
MPRGRGKPALAREANPMTHLQTRPAAEPWLESDADSHGPAAAPPARHGGVPSGSPGHAPGPHLFTPSGPPPSSGCFRQPCQA